MTMTLAKESPLLLSNLAIGHQEHRQQREGLNDASVDGEQQHQLQQPPSSLRSPPQPQQIKMSLPRQMRRQSISSSLLPVIDEGEGGSGDDSSHSSSISSHCRLLGDSVMSHCIIWPPRGYASWPPPSNDHDDGNCEQQQIMATTRYGSLPLSKKHHHEEDSSTSGLGIQAQQCQSRRFSFQTQTTTLRNTHRSLLIATLAFSLMTVATWLPVFMSEPTVESYTTNNFSDLTHVTEFRGATTKLRNASESDNDDDDNYEATVDLKYQNKWAASSHHATPSAKSTLPIYRRSYDDSDRGEKESIEDESGNNEDYNATDITKVDNDIEGTEAVDSDEHHQEDDTPSTSLPSDVTFADLASMMLPTYFQKTVRLCISTIKPAIINHTSFDDVNNVTTTTITKTTSVTPGDVFKLRKTMLKTRDMLDAFSPVYPTESSLDDYDDKKHNDAALIMHFKPWKNIGLEADKMLESNYRNSGVDTERILRTKRRRPPPHEGRSKIKDLWYLLRKFLDRGYTLIGDFQDLDHAKIMHSPDQLAQYQLQVWQWHDEFMTFIDKHRRHISLYLSLPCQTRKIAKKQQSHHHCRYVHSHSSHLFWGSVHSEHDLPDGIVDKATSVLGRLGYMQLGRAEAYLADVLTREHVISTINETTTNATPSTATTTSSLEDDEQGEADMDNEDEDDNENDVHEIYHNLRKELRSFLDELDLFGDLLLPHSSIVPEIVRDNYLSLAADQSVSVPPSPSPMPSILLPASPSAAPSTTILTLQQQTDEAADVLRSVRNMLGDLNDSYVAYAKYLEWNEYLDERIELERKVETQWENFRVWAKEKDLIAKLNFLRGEIDPTVPEHPADVGTNLNSIQAPQSLESFLIEHKANPSNHLVLGNDAGDADSVISAITLAYIESMEHGKYVTPVVAISKYAFVHERPDIALVLELAGVHDASDKLIFIEDLEDIVGNSTSSGVSQSKMTLVDHNTLNPSLPHSIRKNLIVKEIVDHHIDEGKYQETCSGNHRIIAFRDGQPLVSSTTTLVAERMQQYRVPYPPSIGILLLGVILLDSVNLDDAIGKVTERDKIAVDDLVVNTDWSKVTMPVTFLTSDENGDIVVDTKELFNELQLAKYDAHFWSDIPVSRALGYDVKYFHQDEFTEFGVSTILMPPTAFMEKDGFAESTLAFMGTEQITLLGIMFAFCDEEKSFRRQLAFISTDQQANLRLLVESLLNSRPYTKVDLQLEEKVVPVDFNTELQVLLFDQRNVSPSRKEIGPMIEDFFHIMLDGSN